MTLLGIDDSFRRQVREEEIMTNLDQEKEKYPCFSYCVSNALWIDLKKVDASNSIHESMKELPDFDITSMWDAACPRV